jgi:hypothetical protein
MVLRSVNKLKFISILALFLVFSADVTAKTDAGSNDAAAKLLPDQLGKFRAAGPARPQPETNEAVVQTEFNTTGNAVRTYVSASGERLSISIATTASEAGAYALLTFARQFALRRGVAAIRTGDVGTASLVFPDGLLFFKGRTYVGVNAEGRLPKNPATIIELASSFADTLDKGDGEIPVLVKHLPDWQKVMSESLYAVTLPALLKEIAPDQSALSAINFADGVEAVAANYGPLQLVIVEFNTPQSASDNDARIIAKIQELHSQRAAAPTAYRRIGNYSVFVFNGSDEQAANQLIDQVKYQKVVQWLGRNPNIELAAAAKEKDFVDTTLGVFVSVVKASGLAILITLGIGGFFGAVLFRWRRSQQAANEAYTDAGGMLRLNIDEMTPQTDPSKLIGPGN